ncbi:MAG: HAMP domain-containing protein, partial [Armatimonadetes bacterium]|nr:HAMP domain-containing protein [Armatimonadota bacterium]
MNNHESTPSRSEMSWQMRAIGEVVTAVAQGDFTRKVSLQAPAGATWDSESLEIAKTLNGLVDHLDRFAGEATRISHDIGAQGLFGAQMEVEGEAGAWKDLSAGINLMARNLTDQVRDLALVITSIAMGDLSRKVTVDARGEFAELGATINVMADQLDSFASQVTRLTRELGTEGRLGGQIEVKGASGVWQEMTENLNTMSANVT